MQKAVGDLIDRKFFIPFYQRGYRWGKVQIEALLNDLWEFHRRIKKGEAGYKYYSLQPLVVKMNGERTIVIDGQQRLTTLYLLISACEEILEGIEDKFSIEYDRENSKTFLSNIRNSIHSKNQNIDFCYMLSGYSIILNWLTIEKEITKSNLKQFRDFILMGSDIEDNIDINKNIRFIWYELNKEEDEFDVFIRLNIGKIPLTNAELIKSYVIQKDKEKEKRFEISKEWDDIEYSLQNKEFFGFMTTKDINTKIELLFQILLNKETYYEYELYENFISSYESKSSKDIWSEVRDVFHILRYWYEDREFYHLIGYLIATGKQNIVTIYSLYRNSDDKNSFRRRLKSEIKSIIDLDIENDLANLTYNSTETDKKKIKNILLLFNITTLIESSRDTYIKFSFDRFNREKWSLEHITPQTDKIKGNDKKFLESLKVLDIEELNKIITKKDKLDKKDINRIEALFIDEKFKEKFKEKENKDNIRNLTLLSVKDNAGLGNAFFPVKRAKIIEKDEKGEFIPIVTKNIFLKYYSGLESGESLKWRYEIDGEQYIIAMKKSLNVFLGEENE